MTPTSTAGSRSTRTPAPPSSRVRRNCPAQATVRSAQTARAVARWWRDERGSVTAEIVLLAPLLVLVLVFVGVLCHRTVQARLALDDAAHQAARAATLERSAPAATRAARVTAADAVSEVGTACRGLRVRTAGTPTPGAAITVTLTCSPDLDAAAPLGVPTDPTLTASATEVVDTHRSQPGSLP